MLIQDIEKKIKMAKTTMYSTMAACVAICISCFYFSTQQVMEARKTVYVLDGSIPFSAEREEIDVTFDIEAKAHIQMFHQYFFTLAPDDEYIEWTMNKALYLADASAMKQKRAMEEQGLISEIMSSTALMSIITDSILVDKESKRFRYYGTQIIKRKTASIRRTLITTGELKETIRTKNNPHGLLIINWRTLQNKDIIKK